MLLSLSDHFSQIISVKREQIDFKKIDIFQRDYSKFLSESFRDDVSIQNWNDSFKDFYTKLEASVDSHAPLKKLTPREIKIRSKPWLSTEILKMIKIRNKIFARKEATQKYIKNIVNIKKTSIRTTQLKIGAEIIDNDKEIATNFNKFFCQCGTQHREYDSKSS